jgi:hypothetical protein
MAYTDREDLNYLGELFLVGAYQTPFLNMIGGVDGQNSKVSRSFKFPVAQPWALNSASQPAITEAASVTGQTPTTYTRAQDLNTVQIFQQGVEVSYAKQSTYGEIAGLSAVGDQPVKDEMAFQRMAAMRQIALDADYSFLNGAYQDAVNATTAAKTRGIITAATTNTIDASAATLSKQLLDQLLRDMAGNGSVFENPVLFANAFQKQKLTDIYGYAPEDRNVGGVNIKQVETDFAYLGIVYAPNVPTDTILIADMNYCFPVFSPVPDKGLLFFEELAQSGASMKGQVYGQMGLDYGPEEFHGTITNLATS